MNKRCGLLNWPTESEGGGDEAWIVEETGVERLPLSLVLAARRVGGPVSGDEREGDGIRPKLRSICVFGG
jgi:hypothetical protein